MKAHRDFVSFSSIELLCIADAGAAEKGNGKSSWGDTANPTLKASDWGVQIDPRTALCADMFGDRAGQKPLFIVENGLGC